MVTETETEIGAAVATRRNWIAGAAAGLVGGVVFGLLIQMALTPTLAKAIPALWGLSGLAAGWVVHLFDAVVFGLLFAWAVSNTSLRRHADGVGRSAALGLGYGVVLWVVAAGIVMPIWLGVVGFPAAPPLPNFNPMTLPGHVVYGLVLGTVYPLLENR